MNAFFFIPNFKQGTSQNNNSLPLRLQNVFMRSKERISNVFLTDLVKRKIADLESIGSYSVTRGGGIDLDFFQCDHSSLFRRRDDVDLDTQRSNTQIILPFLFYLDKLFRLFLVRLIVSDATVRESGRVF